MKTGFISIVGRTNVGKSTLLNAILGEKISIISDKPQTTRNKIVGIYNAADVQLVFLDTPGFHKPQNKLGEAMIKKANETFGEVDIMLLVSDCRFPGDTEKEIIKKIKTRDIKTILILNKVDKINKEDILKVIASYAGLHEFNSIIPISALKNDGIEIVIDEVLKLIDDNGTPLYPDDIATDRSERFLAGEMIREKILLNLHEEIPHGVAVETVVFKNREEKDITDIFVNIICERDSHKGIIIGKNGQMLKKIASEAREEIENMLGNKVFLECRVKVKEGWRDNESSINEYNEQV